MALSSRSQALLYAALAIAVLLIGARALRSSGQPSRAPAPPAAPVRFERDGGAASLTVHVAGAVRRPGVYSLRRGSRVEDAIRRAGGPTRRAQESAVNLAAKLTDGQQVLLPPVGPGANGRVLQSSGGPGTGDAGPGPVNLGSASSEQLQQIEGIGEKTAAKILEFRQQRGGISRVEDLDAIPGIGPKTIAKLREGAGP